MKTRTTDWRKYLVAGAMAPLVVNIGMAADGGRDPNRFSASGRFLFNVSADFRHLATPTDPGPGVGVHAVNHVYDNGYVGVDDSGNAGNQTWNWGFTDQASVQGTTLQLQTARSPADGLTQKESDDPQFGFEISYGRVLKSFNLGTHREVSVGLQGAFGLTFLDIQNNSTITGATTGVQDTYDLSGLPIFPNAPFYGSAPTPGGPLPLLIPDAPVSRKAVSVPATASERMRVEGNLYGFKLGPFCEVPLTDRLSVQLRGGFAALLADNEFTYSELISTGGTSMGRVSDSDWTFGGYVEGQVEVALSERWRAFAGAGWQQVGSHSLTSGAKAVKVNLDNVISAFVGLDCSF